jgi:hypothetical protein
MVAALAPSILALLVACPAEQPPEQSRDPSLAVLDRLVEQGHSEDESSRAACLASAERSTGCTPLPGSRRTFELRIALDSRYVEHWPRWKERLASTLDCVNRLYSSTGTQWTLRSLEPWDPGADRHNLRVLLDRIQREFPPDLSSVVVGISVWDERRIYAQAGGEIGLSQRAACVIPSWPRLENDCLTLAHELGHIVGARHVPGRENVMAWAGQMFHLPATDAISRVVATHRFDARNSLVMRIYHRARFTKDGLRLPDRCAQHIDLVDRCWNL